MKHYTVEYREYRFSDVDYICVPAKSKEDAYTLAIDQLAIMHIHPYSAWVAGVTYNNGNFKRFNTFEGNPY